MNSRALTLDQWLEYENDSAAHVFDSFTEFHNFAMEVNILERKSVFYGILKNYLEELKSFVVRVLRRRRPVFLHSAVWYAAQDGLLAFRSVFSVGSRAYKYDQVYKINNPFEIRGFTRRTLNHVSTAPLRNLRDIWDEELLPTMFLPQHEIKDKFSL
jgi:hypothetical protein